MLTQKALKALTPSLAQLAKDEKLNHQTLKTWSAGTRVPEAESRKKLQAILRKRAKKLEELADKLAATEV